MAVDGGGQYFRVNTLLNDNNLADESNIVTEESPDGKTWTTSATNATWGGDPGYWNGPNQWTGQPFTSPKPNPISIPTGPTTGTGMGSVTIGGKPFTSVWADMGVITNREIEIAGIEMKMDGKRASFGKSAYLEPTKGDTLQFTILGNPPLMWRECKKSEDITGTGCFWREYTEGTELPEYVQFASAELKKITKVFTQKTKFSNVYLDGNHITIQLI